MAVRRRGTPRGLPYLERALAKRYYPAPTLIRSPQFDALRGTPAFDSLVADAEAGRQRALAAFRQAGARGCWEFSSSRRRAGNTGDARR